LDPCRELVLSRSALRRQLRRFEEPPHERVGARDAPAAEVPCDPDPWQEVGLPDEVVALQTHAAVEEQVLYRAPGILGERTAVPAARIRRRIAHAFRAPGESMPPEELGEMRHLHPRLHRIGVRPLAVPTSLRFHLRGPIENIA